MSKTYSDFLLEVFGHDFWNCIYVFIATSSPKTISLKKVFLPNLLSLGGTFSCFRRTIYGRVDKSAFFVSEGHFMEETFWKNKTYLTFTDFERFALQILHEAATELQNFTFCARELFRGKTFSFEKKSLITELFSDCEWKVSGRIYKKNSKVSRRKSSRHKIHFKKIMIVLGLCRCLFRKIGKKHFCKMFKTAIQLSGGA